MYDYEFFDKFNDDSVHKDWTLTDGTITLTNSDLFQGSLSLNEILSDSNIIFGSCNAAQLKFTTSNLTSLKGKKLNVSVVIDEETENPLTIGSYTVVEDNLTADRTKREVVAYDDIYFLNQTDVADWYNGLTFPISIKDMRDSFFEEVGITQETAELANDSVMIEKTIFPNQLLAIDVLQKICEINGVCGKINRDDEFRYIELNTSTGVNPYPSLTLYPSTSLYPSLTSVGSGNEESEYQIDVYRSLEYADYTVKKINKLQIREDSDDIGGIIGTGDNCYIIEDNFLMYGKSPEDLQTIGNKILRKIRNIEYTPCTVACNGNPCIEIGDVISIEMNNGNTITTIVLNRTLKGEQALIDTYSNDAEEYQVEKVLSLNTEVIQLKGKSARLKRTVEGIESRVEDIEQGDATVIEQLSDRISLKVSKGDVSSEISQEAGQITINGDRLVVNASNFALTAQGDLYTKNSFKMSNALTEETVDIMGYSATSSKTWVAAQDGYTTYTGNYHIPGHYEQVFSAYIKDCIGNRFLEDSVTLWSGFDGSDYTMFDGQIRIPTSASMKVFNNPQKYIRGNTRIGASSTTFGTESGDLYVEGSLTVGGVKARIVTTENFGKRLQSAYETCEPYFGDIGESKTDDNGEVVISIEEIFGETVNTEVGYQVFLQKYGEGDLYVSERNANNFVVKGTPNLSFAYEIKARQKGYEDTRLEEIK